MSGDYTEYIFSDAKASIRVASTENIDLSAPGASIDGVTLAADDRVLVKDQAAGAENGLYQFNGAASPMTRARDANQPGEFTAGALMYVEEGSVNAGKAFILNVPGEIILGTTSLTFEEAYSVPTGGGNIANIDSVAAGVNTGEIVITGTNLSGLGTIKVLYNSGLDFIQWDNPPGGPTEVIVENAALAGETITSIEIYSDFPPTQLIQNFVGAGLPLTLPGGGTVNGAGGIILDFPNGNFIAKQAANDPLTFVWQGRPSDTLDWQPTNGFGLFLNSDTMARIFYGSVQSWNGVGGDDRFDETLLEVRDSSNNILWTGSVLITG